MVRRHAQRESPHHTSHRTPAERTRPVPSSKTRPQPTSHGQRPVVAAALVADPFEPGAKLAVVRNMREHPLHILANSGRITEAQKLAGERFRAKWEIAAIGGQTTVDPGKLRVDGGRSSPGSLSDGAAEAMEWLNRIAAGKVGLIGFLLLVAVCGEGRGIGETARRWRRDGSQFVAAGRPGDGYILGRLVEALDALLDAEGMTAIGQTNRHPNGRQGA